MPDNSGITTEKQSMVFPMARHEDAVSDERQQQTNTLAPLTDTQQSTSDDNRQWDNNALATLLDDNGTLYLLGYAIQLYRDGDEQYRTKADIGRESDIARPTVSTYIDNLAQYGIFKTKGDAWDKYAINHECDILQLLAVADSFIEEDVCSPDE
jgi:hypothetical protein